MKKINIKKINEDIYYEKLDNGMDVYMYVNQNVHNNYVTFTTKYGSIYNEFTDESGKNIKVPNGIAHFLEHKVFVQREDPQPEEFYGKTGALTNAYTTFKNTTYLFSCTNNIEENVNYLLDFVQDLYLTDENVESEKGIINNYFAMTLSNSLDAPEKIEMVKKVSREDIINVSKKIMVHTMYILEGQDEENND